jgi:hypothetical protein
VAFHYAKTREIDDFPARKPGKIARGFIEVRNMG